MLLLTSSILSSTKIPTIYTLFLEKTDSPNSVEWPTSGCLYPARPRYCCDINKHASQVGVCRYCVVGLSQYYCTKAFRRFVPMF